MGMNEADILNAQGVGTEVDDDPAAFFAEYAVKGEAVFGEDEPGDPTAQAAAQAQPGAVPQVQGAEPDIQQLNATWQGRVKKTQDVFATTRMQLQQMGYDADPETGRLIPISAVPGFAPGQQPGGYPQNPQPYQQPQQQAPMPTREEILQAFENDPAGMLATQMRQIINETNQPLMGVLDMLVSENVGSRYQDWGQVKDGVTTKLKQWGFSSVTQALQMPSQSGGSFLDDAVNAIRGELVTAGRYQSPTAAPSPQNAQEPPAQAPQGMTQEQLVAEAMRRLRLPAATSIGASGGTAQRSGRVPNAIKAAAAEAGMDVKQFMQIATGPAKVDVMAKYRQGGNK